MTALSDRIPYRAIVDRPKLSLPGGKRMAVWLILNVEEWRIEKPMPRTVLPPPMGEPLIPDVPNWSWHEYGMRSGFWRQHAALTARDIPVTFAINGNVCNSYPRAAAAGRDAGWAKSLADFPSAQAKDADGRGMPGTEVMKTYLEAVSGMGYTWPHPYEIK